MKKKYNIALIPTQITQSVIDYARLLAKFSDRYLLGENSLPHVTIYQFEVDENEIESIWDRACSEIEKTSIELNFDQLNFDTFGDQIYWVSLLPDQLEQLWKMHEVASKILNLPVKANYDPHMTLINSKDPATEELVNTLSRTYRSIKDLFILALGKRDEVGQFTEVIYSV